ncbi:MAG: dTDP-glucose 4,6-dehydratase [Deltaproteobacteria bacterium]|nr:dTDP-glucose 4,6-dehydratase [Deltaproteobacteria bacterium]
MPTILVTGGAGFIGSSFVRQVLAQQTLALPGIEPQSEFRLVVLDSLTYAGNLDNLQTIAKDPRFLFEKIDITDRRAVRDCFERHRPSAVLNFAAESYVDRSIDDASAFIQTNITGTFELLEAARLQAPHSSPEEQSRFRFLHVSTDEVYGSLGATGLFTEQTPYAPNSPYAASKAAADHLVRAYFHTYGLPTLVTNCSNNYGPFQFPEKLIPLMILNALEGKDLPIYGDGSNVRDWIFVEDHCDGISRALTQGVPGEKYNFGGRSERSNLQVVDALCEVLEGEVPAAQNPHLRERGISRYQDLKVFVKDRPGHDWRYAIDDSKARRDLDWTSGHDFSSGLLATVRWYLSNISWCRRIQEGSYQGQRLGLISSDPSKPEAVAEGAGK